MAKSFPWSISVPTGSEQAATADDHFRRLRLEIAERMGDLVVDWTADPVVLKQELISPKTGKKLLIHPSAFTIEPAEINQFQYSDTGLTISNVVGPTRAPVLLPAGVIIKGIRWLVTNGDSGALSLRLGTVEFAIGTASLTVCDMTSTTTGTHIVDSATVSPFTWTVVHDRMFYVRADKSGGAAFSIHGVEITYDAPDGRSTL